MLLNQLIEIPSAPAFASVDAAVDCADASPIDDFVPLGWVVERHDGCDDSCSIVLIPQGDDEEGPTFALYEAAGGIELIACRWDRICHVGVYTSVEAIVEIIALLTSNPTAVPAH